MGFLLNRRMAENNIYKTFILNFQNNCSQKTQELTLWRGIHDKTQISKVFLQISQNSQENICARVSFLIKLHKLHKVAFYKWIMKM